MAGFTNQILRRKESQTVLLARTQSWRRLLVAALIKSRLFSDPLSTYLSCNTGQQGHPCWWYRDFRRPCKHWSLQSDQTTIIAHWWRQWQPLLLLLSTWTSSDCLFAGNNALLACIKWIFSLGNISTEPLTRHLKKADSLHAVTLDFLHTGGIHSRASAHKECPTYRHSKYGLQALVAYLNARPLQLDLGKWPNKFK